MLANEIVLIHSKYSWPMESTSVKFFQAVFPFVMDGAEESINVDIAWKPRIMPLAKHETNPTMVSFDMADTSTQNAHPSEQNSIYPAINKGVSLRLTHEQSIFSYFNISSDFLSLFLNFYAPLNLD